jgi:gliding motility-associated-like protein
LANGSATVVANGGTPPYTYTWNTNPVQSGPTAINLGPGSKQVTVLDANGCSRVFSVSIQQPPLLQVNLSFTYTSCGQSTGAASSTASGGIAPYSYLWNTTPPQTTPNIANLGAGVYSLTVTDANGCQNQQNASIQSAGNLGASISNVRHSCDEPTGTATANTNGTNPPYTYQWNTTPIQTSAIANNLAPGGYFVVIQDASGCSQILNVKIDTVADVVANLVSVVNASCLASDGKIYVNGSFGLQPYTYQWLVNPPQLADSLINIPKGTYQVVVTDANTCDDTLSVFVSEFRGFSNFFWDEACFGSPSTFYAQTNADVFGYYWNFGDPNSGFANVDSGSVVQHIFTDKMAFPVTLTVYGNCVNDTITKTFDVNKAPELSFESMDSLLLTGTTLVFNYSGSPITTYFWDFGNGQVSDSPEPYTSYSDSGYFPVTLIGTDSLGCMDTLVKLFRIEKLQTIFTPNAFTPFKRGLNEKFKVYGYGVSEIEINIYSRWGDSVYHTQDLVQAMDLGWDGTYKGQPLLQGVYGYKIWVKFANEKELTNTGTISLIR